jgi:hypothetical protein
MPLEPAVISGRGRRAAATSIGPQPQPPSKLSEVWG